MTCITPPQKPDPWQGTRPAKEFGSACPQLSLLITATNLLFDNFDEDCLNLNVHSPEPNHVNSPPKPANGYPVMIWIHGGGYSSSANVQYPGHFMASKGVVVVTINYRLGFMGFLTTEDEHAPGNYGMLDQVMAMQWVQDNIARFDGDPNMVTLYGQSAGASSAALHVLSKRSKGLFHQIICQSGSDLTEWAISPPDLIPKWYTQQLVEDFNEEYPDWNIPTNDSKAMLDSLRTKDIWEMLEADNVTRKPGWISLGFVPVVDHPHRPRDQAFLEDTPFNLRDREDFDKDINIISGLTSEDGSLYVIAVLPDSLDRGYNRTEFLERLTILAYDLSYNDIYEDVTQAVAFEFSPWPHINDLDANRQKFNEMFTDAGFAIGMDLQLKSHLKHNPNMYQYCLGFRSTNASGVVPEWMGVPHNGELPYVWGWSWLQFNENVRNQTGMILDPIEWNQEDAEYADYVMTMWSNFAKFGNPTPEPVWNTTWNKWELEDRKYLWIDRDYQEKQHYRVHELAFWQEYMPTFINKSNGDMGEWGPPTKFPPSTTTPAPTSTIVPAVTARQVTDEKERLRNATIALGVLSGTFLVILLILAGCLVIARRNKGEFA
ncbi:unnamed protein product [Owenia fusiformis]|uniref:Uncharacterized protein n=1 Tax=Owenia fusiformis TaxID=6347 RepID=A0A8J1TR30_OWEFU|nr:unnamed protein product [Owenia fusiformis]